MKQTDKLLKSRVLTTFTILLFFLGSCKSIKKTEKIDFALNCSQNEKENIDYEILNKEFFVLREKCDNIISFCDDGFEQPYRIDPLLVKYKNTDNLSDLYSGNEVFTTDLLLINRDFKNTHSIEENIHSEILNDALSRMETIKKVEFYSRHLKKSYNRSGLVENFNGIFSFDLIKLKFDCIYLKKKCIVIPEFDKNIENKNRKVKSVLVDYYAIIKVYPPLSEEFQSIY